MATSDPLAQNTDRPPIKRQAVVIVHGQGEQRPMGTIRSFVETLWTTDPGLKLKPAPRQNDQMVAEDRTTKTDNPSWIVPDGKGGLYDIQRITCPKLEVDDRRTDFFELYYADLLDATPMRTLWRWLQRLAWVDPRHVTDKMRVPWGTFWVASLLAIALFLLGTYYATEDIPNLLDKGLNDPWMKPAVALIAVMLFLLMSPRLLLFLPPAVTDALRKWGRAQGFALADVPTAIPLLGVFMVISMLLYGYVTYWLLLALAAELYFANQFLLPYFGDAASYLSAHTETVESRQKVRERGLAMLRALQNDNDYDRVIIVAHSLGTVLAYDLIHILWNEYGPTKENPPRQSAGSAIEALETFVRNNPETGWGAKEVKTYQALQWTLFDQLRRQKATKNDAHARPGWKISDLITMGSPLSSAQFLIADGPADYARLKRDRLMPTSPSQPYDKDHQSFYPGPGGRSVAHHGAVFSTVRWTNIYDPFPPFLFFYGDAIGGKVQGADRFGPGISDIGYRIRRHEGRAGTPLNRWAGLARVFTHNHYWTNTSSIVSGDPPSGHITHLRNAVNLRAK